MHHHIALITYLVRDYDEAIHWFQNALGFNLFEDTDLGVGKRWVVMGPDADLGARFLLAKSASPEQSKHIGKAAGGRVGGIVEPLGRRLHAPSRGLPHGSFPVHHARYRRDRDAGRPGDLADRGAHAPASARVMTLRGESEAVPSRMSSIRGCKRLHSGKKGQGVSRPS